jgi:hypothetical protein
MNPLKKGPELKMPELKVPPALEDLFYDLRDRRLLPLVVLALVAIVAVPFLLGDSSSPSREGRSAAVGASVEAAGGASRISHFVVAEADPGLRVPHKRLAKRREKDPFVQKFTAPVVNPGAAAHTPTTTTTTTATGSTGSTETTSGFSAPSNPPSPPASSAPTEENGGGGSPAGQLVAYAYAVDLKIVRIETAPDGSAQPGKPETRKGVLPPTTLPDQKTQVVTYMGLSPKTRKPLFLVSTEVTSVFGEGKCVSGTESCQLLEVEADHEFPETFVYGSDGVRYKITVLGVHAVRVPTSKSSAE